MPEEAPVNNAHVAREHASATEDACIPVEESLSAEDKLILYAALQDIANELRRIDRERKKHREKREHAY